MSRPQDCADCLWRDGEKAYCKYYRQEIVEITADYKLEGWPVVENVCAGYTRIKEREQVT